MMGRAGKGMAVFPEARLAEGGALAQGSLARVARGVAGNFASLAGGKLAAQLLGFLTNAYLARRIAPSGFGAVALAQAAMTYLTILADAGLSTIAVREGSQNPGRLAEVIRAISGLRLLLAGAGVAAGLVCAEFLPYSESSRQILRIYALSLPLTALSVDWAFRALQKMKYNALVQAAGAAVTLGLTLAWIRGPDHAVRAPVVAAASAAFGVALAAGLLKRCGYSLGVRFDRGQFRSYLGEALPLCASSLAITLYIQINYFIVGRVCGESELGIYAAAARVATVLSAAHWLYYAAMAPAFLGLYGRSDEMARRFFRQSVRMTSILGFGLIAAGYCAAPLLVRVVFGEAYQGAAPVLRVMVVSAGIVAVAHNWAQLAIAARRERSILKATAAGGVVNLVLCPLLAMAAGPAGAAASTLAAEVAVAAMLIWPGAAGYRGPALRTAAGACFSCGAAILAAAASAGWGAGASAAVCALVFPAFLALTGSVRRKDWDLLLGLLSPSRLAGGARHA